MIFVQICFYLAFILAFSAMLSFAKLTNSSTPRQTFE